MLSNEQQRDLERAVLEYMTGKGYTKAATALKEESTLLAGGAADTGSENLLERKWLTIVRLQAKIVELERKQAETEEILSRSVRNLKVVDSAPETAKDGKPIIKNPVTKLTKTYKGHKEPINAVAIHKTEPIFCSASSDATIRIYDYELQNQVAMLRGHTHSVNCVVWGQETLYSGSSDMTLKAWASSNKTNAFDFAEFVCIKTFIGHEHSISFILRLEETDFLISCSRDKTIRLWDKSTGYNKRTIHGVNEDWIRTIDSNAKHLLSAGNDRKVFVFDLIKFIQTPDNKDVQSLSLVLNYFEAHENYIESLKLLKKPQGGEEENLVFTASRDKMVGAWNYMKGTCLMILKGHENWVKDIAVVEDSGLLVSVGEDKTIRIWDYKKKKALLIEKNAHEHFVSSVVFHPEFRVLVTGSVDKSSKVWKLANSTSQDLLAGIV